MPDAGDLTIRPATRTDIPALGRLGAALMRLHYEADEKRFMAPGSDPEAGYGWFLGTQLDREDAVVLVAEEGDSVVGYVFAAVEPRSWNELRDEAGFIHDLLVAPEARGNGIGRRLLDAALAWLKERNMPRVVLWTHPANAGAERLFAVAGFRRTMIEMTREL